jgi:hypothetical protein
MGTGLLVAWSLLSIFYLLVREKKKHIRVIFVYSPIVLLLIFFNPWIADLFYRYIGDEIYYRILWLIPMSVLIAYSLLHIYMHLAGRKKQIFAGVACVLLIVSGNYVYDDIHFRPAENLYHIPQSVVEICDYIEVEGREVMAAFPHEMIQYVRQYSPIVCMPYGREVMLNLWGNYDPFYAQVEAKVLDVEQITKLAQETGCHYVIVNAEKEKIGDFESYNFTLQISVQGYDVYLNQSNLPTLS